MNVLYMYPGEEGRRLAQMGEDLEEGGYLLVGHNIFKEGDTLFAARFRKTNGILVPEAGWLYLGRGWYEIPLTGWSVYEAGKFVNNVHHQVKRHLDPFESELVLDVRAAAYPRVIHLVRQDEAAYLRVEERESPDLAMVSRSHAERNRRLARIIAQGLVSRVTAQGSIRPEFYRGQGFTGWLRAVGSYVWYLPLWLAAIFYRPAFQTEAAERLQRIRGSDRVLQDAANRVDVSALAEQLGKPELAVRHLLMRLAKITDVLFVAGRVSLYEQGPLAHARVGVSREGDWAVWLGAKLFVSDQISDLDLARLLLEEMQHILAPQVGHDIIRHDPQLGDRLLRAAAAAGETVADTVCERDMGAPQEPAPLSPEAGGRNQVYRVVDGRLVAEGATGTRYTSKHAELFTHQIVKQVHLDAKGGLTHGGTPRWYGRKGYENREDITVEYQDGRLVRAWAGDPYPGNSLRKPDTQVRLLWFVEPAFARGWPVDGPNVICTLENGEWVPQTIAGPDYTQARISEYPDSLVRDVTLDPDGGLYHGGQWMWGTKKGYENMPITLEYRGGDIVRV